MNHLEKYAFVKKAVSAATVMNTLGKAIRTGASPDRAARYLRTAERWAGNKAERMIASNPQWSTLATGKERPSRAFLKALQQNINKANPDIMPLRIQRIGPRSNAISSSGLINPHYNPSPVMQWASINPMAQKLVNWKMRINASKPVRWVDRGLQKVFPKWHRKNYKWDQWTPFRQERLGIRNPRAAVNSIWDTIHETGHAMHGARQGLKHGMQTNRGLLTPYMDDVNTGYTGLSPAYMGNEVMANRTAMQNWNLVEDAAKQTGQWIPSKSQFYSWANKGPLAQLEHYRLNTIKNFVKDTRGYAAARPTPTWVTDKHGKYLSNPLGARSVFQGSHPGFIKRVFTNPKNTRELHPWNQSIGYKTNEYVSPVFDDMAVKL